MNEAAGERAWAQGGPLHGRHVMWSPLGEQVIKYPSTTTSGTDSDSYDMPMWFKEYAPKPKHLDIDPATLDPGLVERIRSHGYELVKPYTRYDLALGR